MRWENQSTLRGTSQSRGPFLYSPETFSGTFQDIILFVSSKRRCPKPRNIAVIFIFIPFTTYEKTSFTEKAGWSFFTNGFSGSTSFQNFEETAPE